MCSRSKLAGAYCVILLGLSLAACSPRDAQAACTFSDPPDSEILDEQAAQIEIVDAESGEIASYDAQGNPVFEGGQPLALWARFDEPLPVDLCVVELDGRSRPLHLSSVTFSEAIDMQPLGRYDLGVYRLHISTDGTLIASLNFVIR